MRSVITGATVIAALIGCSPARPPATDDHTQQPEFRASGDWDRAELVSSPTVPWMVMDGDARAYLIFDTSFADHIVFSVYCERHRALSFQSTLEGLAEQSTYDVRMRIGDLEAVTQGQTSEEAGDLVHLSFDFPSNDQAYDSFVRGERLAVLFREHDSADQWVGFTVMTGKPETFDGFFTACGR